MKKFYFLLLGLFLFSGVNGQVINFPDAGFKMKLMQSGTSSQIAKNLSGDYFKIDVNNDSEIQVSEAAQVSYLDVSSSVITSLVGILNFTNLKHLDCSNGQGGNPLTSLNVSGLTNLQNLRCHANKISSLNIDGLTNLKILECNQNMLTSLNVVNYNQLQSLYCQNNQLTSLIVSGLPSLSQLTCDHNQLTTLNLSGFAKLQSLICNDNQLINLDLTGALSMYTANIYCGYNQLTSLNIAGMPYLTSLYLENNQISTLNLNGLNDLQIIKCDNNLLTSLNLSNLPNFEYLFGDNNQLTTLNFNGLPKLKDIRINNNNLTEIFYKNGNASFSNFQIANNPNLKFICTDESKIPYITSQANYYGYSSTCTVNSYCSFTPGGTYYTIQGINRCDADNNGCDASDLVIPNLKFSLSNGSVTGSHFCGETGEFTIPVGAGTHMMIPVLENPNYFTFSPSNISINFPAQASPYSQNFCLIPNNNHPDLEMVIIPMNVARPGFIAKYKIIYKNKGTNIQSGTINFQFNNLISSYNYSNPAVSSYTSNNLTWNFTNLMLFETREIELSLNINSPMDTPEVNAGDILNYIVNISSASSDETPNDNTFVFNQTVVNSFDPNDKTCLEGTTISPAMVGEYVHYVIRFENTGTFPAENIVVKDMINLAKFDINTLIPIKGSHEFVTNITAGNKVEFIFENINLPFEDANNDGYVAFKIKTKSSLVVGDTFSNSANIYFDYNFPIITDTYTTTVQTLGKQDFEFSNYFTVYPNPATAVLNLSTKSGITVNNIAIYNTLGQLVIAIPNAQTVSNIDVSSLRTGNYFIKMTTDKGTSNTKFIKN